MLPRAVVSALVALCVLSSASADSALRGRDSRARAQQAAFLDQLEEILGLGHREATETRLEAITEALQTTFASLPKTADGAVSSSSARYAIHRLFVQRHGWHIKGLASQSGSWKTSAPALGMNDRLPQRLVDLVEEQLASDDFHLREMAVLAATVETMVHGEVLGRLNRVYEVLGWEVNSSFGETDAVQIMQTYMSAFLAGYNVSQFDRERLQAKRDQIVKTYPYWKNSESLIFDMQQKLFPGQTEYTFSDILSILEAVNERVGRRVDETNCQDLESRLMQIEEANGTGRVRLRDFYASHLDQGNWQFAEREEFLRHLGVLDETDASATRIMIPNYLSLQANCLNVSSVYDLCCMDKCEDLLGHLELQVQAAHATPERILSLVAALPSTRQPGPRPMTASLVAKLHEVAAEHGGLVPLHGRLFAQWMHFAYPRDCAYPHVAGTVKIMNDLEWQKETGVDSSLTRAEMRRYIAAVESSSTSSLSSGSSAVRAAEGEEEDEDICMAGMWAAQEELVDALHGKPLPPASQSHAGSMRVIMRTCTFLAALLSSMAVMKGALQHTISALSKGGMAKPLLPLASLVGVSGAKDSKALV